MNEDLKKIRDQLVSLVDILGNALSFEQVAAQEALRLFDAHVAALSQQEAEPVGDDDWQLRFKEWAQERGVWPRVFHNETFKAGWDARAPKPAALPQPVESAQNEIEAVTKAILFEDCGSSEEWKENVNLGKAAIKAHRPFVAFWRNDAIKAAASVVERYAPDNPEITHAINNILAMQNSEFVIPHQPVASVPQDVEEWIFNNYDAARSFGADEKVVSLAVLRTWMAGHAMVPVEPTAKMIDAGVAMALQVSVHGQGGWSNYVRDLYKQITGAAHDGK